MDGRVALVTGAGSGLGAVLAKGLARLGATLVLNDRDSSALEALADSLGASAVAGDISRRETLVDLVETGRRAGGPHLLVNNAGGWGDASAQFPDATQDEWSRVLALNLAVPMLATQMCLGPMRSAGGGAVVNIASSAAVELTRYASPEYAVAKAGLIRLTTALGDWSERFGIRVNCLVPDWIGLPRAHAEMAAMSDDERSRVPPVVPPEDASAAVLRLATDEELAGRVLVLRRPGEGVLVDVERWA